MKFIKVCLLSAFATSIVIGTSQLVRAQTTSTFVPANNTDNVLASGLNTISTINCDMLDVGHTLGKSAGQDKLWVITYADEFGSPTAHDLIIGMQSTNFGNTTPLSIPLSYNSGIWQPDVVLGDFYDVNTSQWHYYVAIVYTDLTTASPAQYQVYMDIYEIFINTSSPALTAASTLTHYQIGSSGLYWNHSPHIDLCADSRGYTSGSYIPDMHNFAIVWVDNNGGSDNINAVSGDLVGGGTFNTSVSVGPGNSPDVACSFDINGTSNSSMAYIAYKLLNGSTGWYDYLCMEWNLGNNNLTPVSIGSGVTPFITDGEAPPRIDAATIYDINDPNAGARWNAVGTLHYTLNGMSRIIGGITYSGLAQSIFHFSRGNYSGIGNNVALGWIDAFEPLPNSTDIPSATSSTNVFYKNFDPAICGTGNFLGGGQLPGNSRFTTMFFSDRNGSSGSPGIAEGSVIAYDVDNFWPGSGGPFPGSTCYFVNLTPLPSPTSLSAAPGHYSLGVANCTNTGYDVLTAWVDDVSSAKLYYKFGGSGSTYSFKMNPASVNDNAKLPRLYSVYPNPATDVINVKGTLQSKYTIVNILGRNVTSGTLTKDKNIIDISSLSAGTYLLNLSENGYDKSIKFTKR